MNFLLDTNVVSEWVKQQPNPGVVDWLAEVDEDRARRDTAGRPIAVMDAFIAVTANVHALALVTRNVSAFDPLSAIW